ncbi:MAG: hypothetical protein HC927_00065 [Deltaproteobacteria bacterium]|nr:hypothetical protein [Deltaproteobacteria bacterium]
MQSNEIFDENGELEPGRLETMEVCFPTPADDGYVPVWSDRFVQIVPDWSGVWVDWRSDIWGGGTQHGTFSGDASYRIDECTASLSSSCLHLNRLTLFGGDLWINGIAVSNVIVKIEEPVELPISEHGDVDIPPSTLPLLVTYYIDDEMFTIRTTNTAPGSGRIDYNTDLFRLTDIRVDEVRAGIDIQTLMDVGAVHR